MTKVTLTHQRLMRVETIMLRTLLKYNGPAKKLLLNRYPANFLDSIHMKRTNTKKYRLIMEIGGETYRATDKRLSVYSRGQVSDIFASGLVTCTDRLYAIYVAECGEVTTEPPKTCPNDVHKDWHVQYSRLNDPAFVPDFGYWRCEGCGWLLNSDGTRVHEQYGVQQNKGQTTRRSGGYNRPE